MAAEMKLYSQLYRGLLHHSIAGQLELVHTDIHPKKRYDHQLYSVLGLIINALLF